MLSQKTVKTIREWRENLLSKNGVVNQTRVPSERQLWAKANPLDPQAHKELEDYYKNGTGYKIIAKELGISYTETRNFLLKWTNTETRKGASVVTDELRRRRSENVKGEKSPFYNWVERFPERAEKQTKSIQGWYKNRNGEQVWLRSCLEFIYAKWLDRNEIEWKSEIQTLKGKNETYRPDFFIYENGKLVKVVEIKGNYFDNVDNRSKKARRVCKRNGIKLEIVKDISPYLLDGSYYHKELKEWKQAKKQFAEK